MNLETNDAIRTIPEELSPAEEASKVFDWAQTFPIGWLTTLINEGKKHHHKVFRTSVIHGEPDKWGRRALFHLRIACDANEGREDFSGEPSPVCENPYPEETVPFNPHVYLCQCGQAHKQ